MFLSGVMDQTIRQASAFKTGATGGSCHRLSVYEQVSGVNFANDNSVIPAPNPGKVRDTSATAEAFSMTTRHFSSNNLIAIRK